MSDAAISGLDTVTAGLEAVIEALRANVVTAAEEIAALLEAYAKANHPWKSETGATEASIRGVVVEASEELIVVVLSAGTSAAEFLELARAGRWAWLWPAVTANADAIRDILRRR